MVRLHFDRPTWSAVSFGSLVAALGFAWGCENPQSKGPPANDSSRENVAPPKKAPPPDDGKIKDKPNAKDARKLTESLPPAERVQGVVNPKNRKPYTGETGTVRGVVFATGDVAPEQPEVIAKMEASCTTSRRTFGRLFREGPGRELADALVAVTEYDGFVPAKGKEVVVAGKGCAWDRRTVTMTFGQALVINGLDNRPYVPELLEQPMPAQLFVLPTAQGVRLPPQRPGRFTLVDSMRLFNVATVFVLPYSTADVSDERGEFEISGIPVGEVTVNALLPQTGGVVEQKVTVEAGETVEIKFEIPFDQAEYDKRPKPTPLDARPAPGETSSHP